MTAQRLYAKTPPWILVPSALVVWLAFGSRLWRFLQEGGLAALLGALGMGFLALLAIVLVRNIGRPVVEVDGGTLWYAPPLALRRRSLELGQVSGLAEQHRPADLFLSTLRVELRDGSARRLPLGHLRAVDRARLLALLREAAGV